MDLIKVDSAACKRDGMCVEVCPIRCLERDAEGLPREVSQSNCIACGHCVAVCPHGALTNSRVDMAGLRPMPKKTASPEDLEALMLSRRSVRAYKDKPVEAASLAKLLDLARCAPTAVNTQNVSWAACVDPAKTRQAAALSIEWLRGSGYAPQLVEAWDQGLEVVLRGAPAFVAAYCPLDYTWGETDCVIALSYLELAAAAAGFGTCWAGLLTRAAQSIPALSELMGIPDGQIVRGALMLGHPKYRYQLIPPRNPAKINWL